MSVLDEVQLQRKRAKRLMYAALRKGDLVRATTCEQCGAPPKRRALEGHHHKGYSDEFAIDVVWLCGRCHQFAHPPRFSRPRTDDEKLKISQGEKRAFLEGRHAVISFSGEHNGFYGKKHTDEARQKMRKPKTRQPPKIQCGVCNELKTPQWINRHGCGVVHEYPR